MFQLSQWFFVYQYFKVSLLMPLLFVSYVKSTSSDQAQMKKTRKILWRLNFIYIAFTLISGIVNILHVIFQNEDRHVLKICSLLPFILCLVVYTFSLYRIRKLLRNFQVFTANKYLRTYPYLVLVSYVFHLARWPIESWWLDIE